MGNEINRRVVCYPVSAADEKIIAGVSFRRFRASDWQYQDSAGSGNTLTAFLSGGSGLPARK